VSSSAEEKGSDIAQQVEESHSGSKSSAVSSNSGRTPFKPEENTTVYTMSGLTQIAKDNEVPADESSRTSPVIIRKSIKKDSGFAEQHDKGSARELKPYLSDKKIDTAQTNHSDLSKDQLAVIRKNEDLMKAAKNEKRQSNNIIVEVEIEVSNGNGVNGMASRLGSYLRERGFKVTRLKNANSFNHEKTKIFYYNGHLQDTHRLLQEIPGHIDMKYIIELKQMGNRLKILIGKDMIPYDEVISKAYSTKHTS
jgi:hypothetical protein